MKVGRPAECTEQFRAVCNGRHGGALADAAVLFYTYVVYTKDSDVLVRLDSKVDESGTVPWSRT